MTATGYWWLALLMGLVVAVVLVVLLHTLLKQVWRIERAADEVWLSGKQVATNTAHTWVLGATVGNVKLLSEEIAEHRRTLGPMSGGGSA